ncbi:MAG: type I 3-dehydroquinate dehydratase [Thermoanaerobaculia bacterium]
MESSQRVERADRADRAIVVASLTEPPAADGRDLELLGASADWLEVRADLVGDIDPDWLRAHFPGELLYTLRSAFEGGAFEGSRETRLRRIGEAAPRFDRVDLEGERDSVPELLARIPAARRIVSWHGAPIDLAALQSRLAHLATVPAAYYKLVPGAANAGEELAPLALLAGSARRDVIAFASGAGGFWTRILAPHLGAPVIFGSASARPAAPGQPSVTQLTRDYGFPALPRIQHLFGLVGWPALQSLSPRLHNAAYRELGIPALYVPFDVEQFGDFWLELVESDAFSALGLTLGGMSITTPHKEVAFAVAGATSPLSERLQAVNTLTPRRGVWEGESTDAEGVVEALRSRGIEPRDLRIAVIGCGGAGRAAAVGLTVAGAKVVLANRGPERGMAAARSLGLPFVPLDELVEPHDSASPAHDGFDVYVHATPLGRRKSDELPLPVARIPAGAVIVDLVYGERPTPLVAEARRRGLTAIDGREVLLYQAIPQFRAMTGRELPLALARQVLGLEPGLAPGLVPEGM